MNSHFALCGYRLAESYRILKNIIQTTYKQIEMPQALLLFISLNQTK